jgi:hypothetical protein
MKYRSISGIKTFEELLFACQYLKVSQWVSDRSIKDEGAFIKQMKVIYDEFDAEEMTIVKVTNKKIYWKVSNEKNNESSMSLKELKLRRIVNKKQDIKNDFE